MYPILLLLCAAWIVYLIQEAWQVHRARTRLTHVVHVNGTRGKSTVSRLIDAGLRAGGLQVFCKTTGTDPMTIDVCNRETLIQRRGPANIKEQIGILKQAARQNAQVLVVECMAIQPELQYAAQHQILNADIGVITNVRQDHGDVMGHTLEDVAEALSNTVPKNGILFTAESRTASPLLQQARRRNTTVVQTAPDGTEPEFDFAENIALALAVCRHLGVDRETALEGMKQYHRDPYALTVHRLGNQIWINGLSINDTESACLVLKQVQQRLSLEGRPLVLLINNRTDRGSRTEDMLQLCCRLVPDQIWLSGAGVGFMRRKLAKKLPQVPVRTVKGAAGLSCSLAEENSIIFAVGNIAQGGREITDWIKQGGIQIVP